jgi:hypothetical protein
MVKNNPENLFSRVDAEKSTFGADKRYLGGSDPIGLAAFAAAFEGQSTPRRDTSTTPSPPKAQNGRSVDFGDVIGKELQSLYDDVVAQPVPDRFLSLLNQLEKTVGTETRSVRDSE